jgi:hypothetical protein
MAHHWQMQKWRPWTNLPTHAYAGYIEKKDSIVFTCEADTPHAVTGEVIRHGALAC